MWREGDISLIGYMCKAAILTQVRLRPDPVCGESSQVKLQGSSI